LGLGFISIGGLYAVNRISSSAIMVLESLPYWLSMKELRNDDKNTVIINKEQIKKGVTAYGTMVGLILFGTALGVFGRFISAESSIDSKLSFPS
jgi:hypothetical protein